MDKSTLQEHVESALSDIFEQPNRLQLRCHEISRLMKNHLSSNYPSITVKDGIVRYAWEFLDEMTIKDFLDEDPVLTHAFLLDMKEKNRHLYTPWYIHSWCEVDNYIIDHHNQLGDQSSYQTNLLLIEPKQNMIWKAQYHPIGKTFTIFGKDFIYFPPYYFSKIRINKNL